MIESVAGVLDGFDLAVAADRISVQGHTTRGALYGVYQLLEDMGCRWYYPGSLGEVVPAASTLSVSPKTTSQNASFRECSVMLAYPCYYDHFHLFPQVGGQSDRRRVNPFPEVPGCIACRPEPDGDECRGWGARGAYCPGGGALAIISFVSSSKSLTSLF